MTVDSSLDQADDPWFTPLWTDGDRREAPTPTSDVQDASIVALDALIRAQDTIARLEAAAGTASGNVVFGLRARLAMFEAAGILGHRGFAVHPYDLALQAAGVTGGAGAAALTGSLSATLPWSVAGGLETPPEDQAVRDALAFAREWCKLGLQRAGRKPHMTELTAILGTLGHSVAADAAFTEWLAALPGRERPALVCAAWAARPSGAAQGDRLDLRRTYVAAYLWKRRGFGVPVALGFWAAPLSSIDALAWKDGALFQPQYFHCITEAALRGRRELARLQTAERRAATLSARAGAHLHDAASHALRTPVLTPRTLGEALGVTTRAGLGLVTRLMEAGLLREATRRRAWRAYVLA